MDLGFPAGKGDESSGNRSIYLTQDLENTESKDQLLFIFEISMHLLAPANEVKGR